jgi:hypothetical protein
LRLLGGPRSLGAAKTGVLAKLTRRDIGIMGIARRSWGNIGRLSLCRVAYTVIRISGIILLSHIGRLELPVSAAIPLSGCRTRLLPLPLVFIPAIDLLVLRPLTLMIILSIGIPMLLPLPGLAVPSVGIAAVLLPLTGSAIPPVSIATRLLPLTVSPIPTISVAAGLLPPMRLAMPAISKGTRLGPAESLTIHVPGKGSVRSSLSC